QIGLVSTDSSGPTERSDAFNTTRAPAGSSLSAPGMLAAPYGTGAAKVGTGPGAYGIHTQNQVRANPGITYGTQGQLDTGMGRLDAPYGTGTGRLGGGASALVPLGAVGGEATVDARSPRTAGVYGAGASG